VNNLKIIEIEITYIRFLMGLIATMLFATFGWTIINFKELDNLIIFAGFFMSLVFIIVFLKYHIEVTEKIIQLRSI
jgi:predicted neutral ceramidase superfamily lipid hydrolase